LALYTIEIDSSAGTIATNFHDDGLRHLHFILFESPFICKMYRYIQQMV
jgi:hypothetical protein